MVFQAFAFLSSSNILERSTIRSLTTGNFVIGSIVIGWVRESTRAAQAWRTFPLINMVQAPQTSSKQLDSQTTGVTFSPFLFLGLRTTYIRQAITFI